MCSMDLKCLKLFVVVAHVCVFVWMNVFKLLQKCPALSMQTSINLNVINLERIFHFELKMVSVCVYECVACDGACGLCIFTYSGNI